MKASTPVLKPKLITLGKTFEGYRAFTVAQDARQGQVQMWGTVNMRLFNGFNELPSKTLSIVLCTGSCSLSVRSSSPCDGLGLPGVDLRLRSVV